MRTGAQQSQAEMFVVLGEVPKKRCSLLCVGALGTRTRNAFGVRLARGSLVGNRLTPNSVLGLAVLTARDKAPIVGRKPLLRKVRAKPRPKSVDGGKQCDGAEAEFRSFGNESESDRVNLAGEESQEFNENQELRNHNSPFDR